MSSANRGHLNKIKDEVEFYDHQVEGVRWIAKAGNALLCDEMGLGKTLTALTVAAVDFDKRGAKRVLVVTLATLKANWQEEIHEHTLFSSLVLEGSPTKREKQLAAFDKDVLIVNYEQVVAHWPDLNDMHFDVIIYDEAHAIKNRGSDRTKACLKLDAARHILVTGSPMLNQIDDLWTLLHRVDPDQFPKYWTYRNRYAVFGGYKGNQIIGVKNEVELNKKLSSVMLRRLKKDALDLPEKQFIRVWVDLTNIQRKLYDEAKDESLISLPDDPNPMQIENALVKFLRLKEICGTAAAIPGFPDSSGKLDRAVQIVQEAIEQGEPIVLFTQFRAVLKALEERLRTAGIPTWVLHGDVPTSERVPRVREWTEASEAGQHGAILCMFQVGGVGLNMTAASKIILVDKLFVPKLNEQAVDRIHRIGATRPVQIYELLCRRTIEQRVEQIIGIKNRTFDGVVDGDMTAFKRKLIEAFQHDGDDDDIEIPDSYV